MSYIEKARELGDLIAETPEVQELKSAQAAINAEPEARDAFAKYQEKEQQLVAAQLISKVVPEKESLALLDLKVRLIGKYPTIKNFFLQQQKLEKIMAMVNLTLTTSIYGMPSAQDLPIPDEIKGMAQKLLDGITGDKPLPTMDIPKDLKIEGLKFPLFKTKD